MATLLHLTDLHLDTPEDHAGADFKNDIVPLADRPDRAGALRSTLQALGESKHQLDGIVITGDIPFQNGRNTKGWEQFATALEPLETTGKMPPPEKIVVTPGNHDVAWRKPIGDPGHYEAFLEHVRAKGYVTPLLDGIDINADGQSTSSLAHHLLDTDLGIVVVPINSSHYCGALEPLGPTLTDARWEDALNKLRGIDAKLAEDVSEQITSLRAQDIARISEPQFKALTTLVASIKQEARDAGTEPASLIWIAALHHHLLPVSTDEEFKSYESMTNLGRFRQLLVDLGFDVVLHGHKHSAGVFWDHVHGKGGSLRDHDPKLLVVSGSTAGAREEGTQEMARLIAIESAATTRAVTVSKVPVLDHGARLPGELLAERADLWEARMALEVSLPRRIVGPDAERVYDRIQALFASASGQAVPHLVCEIRSPHGADTPPGNYPVHRVPGGSSQAESWFRDTVQWWQRPQSKFQFTHGQRLRAWGSGPDRVNQIEEARRLLQNDSTSSRAVITLIDPSIDKVAEEESLFPAFSFAHLVIRAMPGQARRLDCLGFFRKQEMRFWWPINVAELAEIQREVCDQLSQPDLRLGSIVTYASLAHVGTEVPDVNITAIDRLADGDEDELWKMAYGLVHPKAVDGKAVKADWLRILADLDPADGDRPPRPQLGVKLLLEFVERFDQQDDDAELEEACKLLRTLQNDYLAADSWDPGYLRERITSTLDRLRELVENRLPSDAGGTLTESIDPT
jgi:hypothetical protein